MLRKGIVAAIAIIIFLTVAVYSLNGWRNSIMVREKVIQGHVVAGYAEQGHDLRGLALPAFDAHGFDGVQEINRPELAKLMSKFRPLSPDEEGDLDRGCPGFTCLYQGLGLTRWPEVARDTLAYLNLNDALKRCCPDGQENFVFLKQGWWLGGGPPMSNPVTGQVSVNAVTRVKPGWYTFNYAVYFPCTATYVWINHRNYGFPVNLIKPQKAYLSLSPPPLDPNTRPAQIYCSTCR